jgi:hypothetical protein
MHHETPWLQVPLTHEFEQQSPSCEQPLPDVLQLVLSGVHVWLLPQVPLQHSVLLEQVWPSETQASLAHVVPLQRRLQQSVAVVQPAPGPPHAAMDDSHEFVTGLHVCEQHSAPPLQSSPYALQVGPDPALAPLPVAPAAGAPPSAAPALPPLFELAPVPPVVLPPVLALVVPPLPAVPPLGPALSPAPPMSPASPPDATVPPAFAAALPPVPDLPLEPPALVPPTPTAPACPLAPWGGTRVSPLDPHAEAIPSEIMPNAKSFFTCIYVSRSDGRRIFSGSPESRFMNRGLSGLRPPCKCRCPKWQFQ